MPVSAPLPPTLDEVERVARMSDPAVRNLHITDTYHRLAIALGAHTGSSANWCAFATWASRQAGQTIRGEDLLETLRVRLDLPVRWVHPIHSLWRKLLAAGLYNPETRLGRIVRAVQGPLDPFERASQAVARGNLKVFEEIGREFARFLAECCGAAPDPRHVAPFVDRLRDGDPPDGQRLLRQAFTRYAAARAEADPVKRAHLMYLANLEVGWHEQTRLQPEIQEALDAPALELRELGERVLRAVSAGATRWRGAIRTPLALGLGTLAWPFARAARHLARAIITDCMMTLRVPASHVLRLGRTIEVPFPESLRRLDDEVSTVVARFRCDAHGTHDCGARDWAVLDERMHYIAHLFRAFHEDPALATPPFSDAQRAAIAAGSIPDGEL